MIMLVIAFALVGSIAGCGSSSGPAASPIVSATPEPSPSAGAVEKTPPPWLAKVMENWAANSGEPRPTWGEWTLTTQAQAGEALDPGTQDTEVAQHPENPVYVVVMHGRFENTRAGSGPPGYEGTPPPTVFAWSSAAIDAGTRRDVTSTWASERPDTSALKQMYVYEW
jgi:hypothetical protein